MANIKFQLAQKSADYGIDGSALVFLSDLFSAIRSIVTSASDLAPDQVKDWIYTLSGSIAIICQYLGAGRTSRNTSIHEIIEISDGFDEWLKDAATPIMRSRHLTQLQLILTFARSMGYPHELFTVANEWDGIGFIKMDRYARAVIDSFKRAKVHPQDVTEGHLATWKRNRQDKGYAPGNIRQSISQFKHCIRKSGIQASFPHLNFTLARPDQYGVAMQDMHPDAAKELSGMVKWLSEQDESGILRMSEETRNGFVGISENLYGYAETHPAVGKVLHIKQIFAQVVITDFARWAYHDHEWKQGSISMVLHRLHSVLTAHPSLKGQDWKWILKLIEEFPEEPESVVEKRRRERAFDYDYATLATIPEKIREKRLSAEGLSDEEKGWMIHDELLMLLLLKYPWPPRCIRECRISGDAPNLVLYYGRPQLDLYQSEQEEIK